MFAYLHRTLYEVLLQADDDFFIRCRKGFISVAFVFGIVNFIVNTIAAVFDKEWPVLNYVVTSLIYVQCLVFSASWAYARRTRTCPDWLINLSLDMAVCVLLIMSFSSANWGFQAFSLSVAFAAIVIGTSHVKFQVTICSFVFIVNCYDMFVAALGFPSILIPGHYKGNILFRQIINGVTATLGLWLLYLVKNQFTLLIAKAVAALYMVKEITKKLVLYDTDGALALLLSENQESSGVLDAEFVSTLTQMIDNLALFRSQFPNYLIDQLKSEKAPETVDQNPLALPSDNRDFSDCNDEAVDDVVQGEGASSSSDCGEGAGDDQENLGHDMEAEEESDVEPPVEAPEPAEPDVPIPHAVPGEHAVDLQEAEGSHEEVLAQRVVPQKEERRRSVWDALREVARKKSVVRKSSKVSTGSRGEASSKGGDMKRRKTIALFASIPAKNIMCAWGHVCFYGPDGDTPRFVDLVYAQAKKFQAGVHCFLGDKADVTWNVTLRAPSFESKSLQFLLELRNDPGDTKAYGAVSQGRGQFRMAGGELQTPLLRVDWFPRLQALSSLAAHHDAVLTCRYTYTHAQFFIEARCVDLIGVGEEKVDVFEVLRVRPPKAANMDEEWLYTLQSQGNTGNDLCNDRVSHAVKMCRQERFLDALTVLEELPGTEHSMMTHRLQEKVQRCVERSLSLSDFLGINRNGL